MLPVNQTHIINPTNQTNMKIHSITKVSATKLALCAAISLFASNAMSAEKDTLDATDVAFVKHAAASGMAEVRVAGLGVQKADNTEVKTFAEMLVTDHTQVNTDLKKLASTKGVELSAVIEPDHAAAFQALEKFSGPEFDKQFLAGIISDHKTCISSFEDASKNAKDGDVKAFADKMIPTLKAHQAKAEELSAK
ncbi:MAG: DUF4142 domain-containing protein [Verrucomicrobia bacterium]|nr:DUF4142 domain-containing protein [Verrucomicrobiota bacterium]